jgi:hypothetical protein
MFRKLRFEHPGRKNHVPAPTREGALPNSFLNGSPKSNNRSPTPLFNRRICRIAWRPVDCLFHSCKLGHFLFAGKWCRTGRGTRRRTDRGIGFGIGRRPSPGQILDDGNRGGSLIKESGNQHPWAKGATRMRI